MSEEDSKSVIEITLGPNEIHIEGTEEFVSSELETVLERIDIAESVGSSDIPSPNEQRNSKEQVQREQTGLLDQEFQPNEQGDKKEESEPDPLETVANRIQVDSEQLKKHFYVEESQEGYEVHIYDPTQISSRAALLGYCTIKEILTGETYHDNQHTKERLIDEEKVDINGWGSQFLYNLRRDGLIKDDPSTDLSRNKPFSITPKGREWFVSWLRE